MKKQEAYFSAPLEKGMNILSLFAKTQAELSLVDIAKSMGITKTSAYRFTNTLVELGYLRKDPRSKLLKLGTKAFILANGFLRSFDAIQAIKPLIDKACADYQVTVDSALLEKETLFVLYRREVGNTLTHRLPTQTMDLTCTALGKAVLAFLPEDEQLELVNRLPKDRKTDNTLTTVDSILQDLQLTKKRGYSLNNEELLPGLIAIGAPLISMTANRVVGSICFDLSAFQHSAGVIEQKYSGPIMKLGREISEVIPDLLI